MEFFKSCIVIMLKGVLSILTIFKIDNKKILFYPANGRFYCNLKYITLELLKQESDINVVWVLTNERVDELPESIKIIKKNTFTFFYHYMTSKLIIFNNALPSYLPKRSKQVQINTWHGGGAYKKIDAVFKNIPSYFRRKRCVDTANNVDFVVSACKKFTEAFMIDTGIDKANYLSIGLPRNDVFFDELKIAELRKKVFDYYQIREYKKIALYAPTFRDGDFINDINVVLLQQSLCKYLKGEYIIFLRCHPHKVTSIFNKLDNTSIVIDVTEYTDMQELLCATDVLITDYSSCMWDFSLMYKPCFIYATDIDEYKLERDFHTPMNEWPFPIAKNNDELFYNIEYFNFKKYTEDIKKHHENLGTYETGLASIKMCRLIKKICG